MQISELKDRFLLRVIIWQILRVQVVRGSYEHMNVCVRFLRVTLDFPSSKMITSQPLTFCWTEQKNWASFFCNCFFIVSHSIFIFFYNTTRHDMVVYDESYTYKICLCAWDTTPHFTFRFTVLHFEEDKQRHFHLVYLLFFFVFFKKPRLFQAHALPGELQ